MKSLKIFFSLFIALTVLASCGEQRDPRVEYMPDMYRSVPYKTDGENGIKGEPVNLKPVDGTIARGGVPDYEYEDSPAGYDLAKAELKNPLEASEENLENGKAMYEIYCVSCHGKKGDGKGYLATSEKFAGIPNYKDRDITAGSVYHVLMHGKNLMGSHSSQLTYKERWQIIHYVEQLRAELLKQ